jgi:hypothetical protein
VKFQELIDDYEQNRRVPGGDCKICSSPHAELINTLLQRGAGSSSLSEFLQRKLNVRVGESSIRRHKRMHLDA